MNVTSDSALIQVLCVDDHPLIREGIAAIVEGEPDMRLVGEAMNGREAIESFRRNRPDVTLMDLRLPDMNGIEAIARIRSEFPDARIIVLMSYAGDAQALGALQAGAYGLKISESTVKAHVKTILAKLDADSRTHGVMIAVKRGIIDV
jgi:DNA-binding NarL/FixJ family response regulator